MSSKILLSFLGGCLALFLVMGITTIKSEAQVVSGNTAEPSGQLIIPFDNRDMNPGAKDTFIQVTNTSIDVPVNIHVQVMDGATSTCAECDFFDTLTPSDTVVYDLLDFKANELLIDKSRAEKPCDTTSHGVVVITPTLGANPDQSQPIAHNHLHGVVYAYHAGSSLGDFVYVYNAVGRDAIVASGAKAADGTILDGVAATFASIIPNSYNIQYTGPDGEAGTLDDLVGNPGAPVFADALFVAISDDFGGGSYTPQPGTSPTFAIDIFDKDEDFQSCDETSFTCIDILGINNVHTTTSLEDGALDCATDDGTPIPDDGCLVICGNVSAEHLTGYTRLRSIGGGDADVNFGILGLAVTDAGGASHIFVK